MSDQRGQLLRAALGFAGLPRPSYDRSLWALRTWLDSWAGIGRIAVGMARQGYDLQLTRYDERGWRATFYTTGMEHSPTSATGTGWERTPWHATQRAAREVLKRAALGVRRCLPLAAIQLAALLSLVSVAASDSSERDDLDRIWNEHMLDGRAALIVLDKSSEAANELGSVADLAGGRLKAAMGGQHAIVVRRVGKGIWTNGGWILQGGRVGGVELSSGVFELFGKEVIRRIPYFPFPFHRDPPHESGCEFFLVRREQRGVRSTIVRQWVFLPQDVKLSEYGSTDISATVTREPGTETLVITASGLKRPFVQRIALANG